LYAIIAEVLSGIIQLLNLARLDAIHFDAINGRAGVDPAGAFGP
jgi:hypothetical protein